MNRRDLVTALAEKTGMARKDADAALGALVDIITENVAAGEPVMISGFAKFVKVQTAARKGRNPATGEEIQIPARTKVRVTPLKAFKDTVLNAKGKAPAKKR